MWPQTRCPTLWAAGWKLSTSLCAGPWCAVCRRVSLVRDRMIGMTIGHTARRYASRGALPAAPSNSAGAAYSTLSNSSATGAPRPMDRHNRCGAQGDSEMSFHRAAAAKPGHTTSAPRWTATPQTTRRAQPAAEQACVPGFAAATRARHRPRGVKTQPCTLTHAARCVRQPPHVLTHLPRDALGQVTLEYEDLRAHSVCKARSRS